MKLANPRWLSDGAAATQFVFGRQARMAICASDFPGGEITFKLHKDLPAPPLTSMTVSAPATGATLVFEGLLALDLEWLALPLPAEQLDIHGPWAMWGEDESGAT